MRENITPYTVFKCYLFKAFIIRVSKTVPPLLNPFALYSGNQLRQNSYFHFIYLTYTDLRFINSFKYTRVQYTGDTFYVISYSP